MSNASSHPVPLILDVDTGIDDSLALLFAAASADAELVGVTTAAGNVELEHVTRNTLAVLELAGRGEVEVAAGAAAPLCRPLTPTPETHGPEGIGRATLPAPAARQSDRCAAQLIVEQARARPGELTLVALGPLTNVATAVLWEPELPTLLKRLVIMGGTFREAGNTTPVTEWNMTVDPEAAACVLRRFGRDGAPLPLLMGLDVTQKAAILPHHLAELRERAGDVPLVRFVEDSLGFYFDFHERYDGFRGAHVHDPFVVGCVLDPALLSEHVALHVGVELGGEQTAGQTFADWKGNGGEPPNAEVPFGGEGERYIARLLDRLVELAART
ncbi:nucleoside hydrolase [Conexibacter woesei]|uniref:Inosine/uridine-preferring nucleoside hydrolase n=1 Tax=Conexibacter woesei (strain DSM 14684 / CCUG 47730 / CIP 108061 / JCM 11494 / NBRC 100937 / ID131577) TaxID=469383 RepID=D3F2G0_CONWI|nr:nucleoside hydrolase [Conexibacter woesei]ADB52226.1 Inosine/uridine-preferring nucleoside hydrolase [Conexibacter woesei DSM 14684]